MPIGIHRYWKPFEADNLPPLPEQKSKSEVKRETYDQYVEKLPSHCDEKLTLVSERSVAEIVKRMRIRGSKPGQGKKSTHHEMLAKGTRHFDLAGNPYIKKNNDFGKYNERPYRKYAIGVNLENKDAKLDIHHCTPSHLYAIKDANSGGFVYTEYINRVKQLTRLNSFCFINVMAMEKPNDLLRQILLFKGIGFTQVENDIRENDGKPVTYNVNTRVEYDRNKTNNANKIVCITIHSITVKKTFRNKSIINGIEEEQCNMFFSSENCRIINTWKEMSEIIF